MKKLLLVISLVISLGLIGNFATEAEAAKKPIVWRASSSWTAGPGHQESAEFFAKTLNELSGGRLVIKKMFSAGELMGAMQIPDAVSAGKLDIGHSSLRYATGKIPWCHYFCGSIAQSIYGMEENLLWLWEGGGIDLFNDYIAEKGTMNIIWLPAAMIESEPLWTIKPVRTLEDFKGLKIRASGPNKDFYDRMGCAAVTMPMGEVVPALERKVIDGAEFCVPYTDIPAGLHEICPYVLAGYLHQPSASLDLYINKDSWNALPDDLKEIVKHAAKLATFWHLTYMVDHNMKLMDKAWGKINVTVADEKMQKRAYEIGEEMASDDAAKYPIVKEVLKSQREFHNKFSKYRTFLPRIYRD